MRLLRSSRPPVQPTSFRMICQLLSILVLCLAVPTSVFAQSDVTVTGQVEVLSGTSSHSFADASQVVVWLNPLFTPVPTAPLQPQKELRLVQRHKSFMPHLLVVQAGSIVEFPNEDPFFHNVFSLFQGKRFDLGLYEAGSTRAVLFDKIGICYLFCNIHPEMSAVIVVVKTPYFAISDRAGQFAIPGVRAGRYELRLWSEHALTNDLNSLTREVNISDSTHSVGTISLRAYPNQNATHKNKYGRQYDSPTPPNSLYLQP
jgi:plastocyanin